MLSTMIRSSVLMLAVATSFGMAASRAQAEPIFIGGFGFMLNHPLLPVGDGFELNKPTNLPGPAAALVANDPEADFGLVAGLTIRIDLSTYVTTSDTVILEDAVFEVDTNGDTLTDGQITFSFSPAQFSQVIPPPGIIGSGDIQATITGATTTLAGVSVSQFVGGSFQMTFTGAKITAGAGSTGGGRIVFDPVPTASFTISTPEPTSVALSVLGVLGAVGLCYRMRRS